jgi:replicative DNA helicase
MIDSGSIKSALEEGVNEEHFPAYADIWRFVEQYVRRNGKAPTRQIMEARYPKLDLPIGQQEEVGALLEHLKHDWLFERASTMLDEASQLLLKDEPQQAVAFLQGKARDLSAFASTGQQDSNLLQDWDKFFQDAVGRMAAVQGGAIRGTTTGFATLDERTGGLDSGELVTVVARQGEGKSWALMHMAVSAVMQGKKVCFFPLEMSPTQVAFRMHVMFQHRLDPSGALRNNSLVQGKGYNLAAYRAFLERLAEEVPGQLIMCQSDRRFSTTQVLAKLQEHQPDLIVIDYLTLMALDSRELEGWSDIRILTKELKSLATEFQIPIIVAAQANRVATNRKGPPELADIAFGDAIGMDSDRVLSFKKVSNRVTHGRVIKNRHGDDMRKDLWLYTDYNRGQIMEIDQNRASEIIDEDKDHSE